MRILLRLLLTMPLLFAASCAAQDGASFGKGTLVVLGGDTHFGENYASFDDPCEGSKPTPPLDYARGFDRLKPLLDRADLSVVNLETPLSCRLRDANLPKKYVHWTNPEKAGPALAAAGIDAVGLANNHTLDQGPSGLVKTLSALKTDRIATFGAGTDLTRARAPLVHTIRLPDGGERTLAIFGMFEVRPTYRDKLQFYAGPQRVGVAPIDVAAFGDQVKELRKTAPDAFIIAFPHWGRNYAWANRSQVKTARALVDAGADLVVGQHAHTLQEIEYYHDKWILYGIGNFVFNAPGRYADYPKVMPFGLVAELSFGEDPKRDPAIRLHPFLSDNRRTSYQPRPATAQETRMIMSTLQSRHRSVGFNGKFIEDDPAGSAIELRKRSLWAI